MIFSLRIFYSFQKQRNRLFAKAHNVFFKSNQKQRNEDLLKAYYVFLLIIF